MPDTLQSVKHALRILDALQGADELGITDIASELGCAMSTAHRLVSTLAESGYVQRSATSKKYRLGPAMLGANDAAAIEHCIEKAKPHMEALRDATGETVQLAVLQKTSIRFVAGIESHNIMRVTSRVGASMPAHATAAGKLLLSCQSEQDVKRLYPAGFPPRLAPSGAETLEEFMTVLAHTRADAHGRSVNEVEPGVTAFAVPVHRPNGKVLCALALSGPTSRLLPDGPDNESAVQRALLKAMRTSAGRVSAELAF